MQVICAKCSRALDFSGDPPSFCAYCGQALSGRVPHTPPTHDPDAPTLPAGPPATAAAPALPPPVRGYRFVKKLGSGGMGGVFEAEEIASGRRVALKLVAPDLIGSADTVERFRQEGRIASMVAHPRCVFVHAVDEDAGRPYIVMELMGGETLKDLIDRRGPLPPEEAIAKILDVIEGLQEAHKLEVIHRDVKPSNCFLEPDGRVKVGDFGLAKSLVKDAHLTKTGSFVGTPFFASPEQVRGEGLDRQTDVYSVAATLYYLLAGQPPFWGSDSAATLARIVSDPAPSLRSVRPELSPALDRVILRGLERDRKRRWQSLEELRQALQALVPTPLSWNGMPVRLGAYVLDVIALGACCLAILLVLKAALPAGHAWPGETASAVFSLLFAVAFLGYFTVLEHGWGCSLGKGLFHLRVCSFQWIDPPGWGAVALRAVLFFGFFHLPLLPAISLPALRLPCLVIAAAGLVALLWPMRERNGFRGLHEILSGTRLAFASRPQQDESLLASGGWLLSLLQSRKLDRGVAQAGPLPQRVGGFAVRGALKWSPGEKVLLGEDSAFGRRVFLWLRPQGEPALDPVRRDIGRRTRLRWLASGKQGDLQWDAILAPSGCPLPDYVRSEGSLAWPEARTLLASLAGELSAACADGTLPRALSPAQVWVQAGGQARLADTALVAAEDSAASAGTDQERALALLRQTAILALEGRPRPPQEPAGPLRVSLPAAAEKVLGKLLALKAPYTAVDELRDDLAALPEV
jgi:uncharacterized RDD family membrane protein YckC